MVWHPLGVQKKRRREWTKKQRQSDGTTTRGTKKSRRIDKRRKVKYMWIAHKECTILKTHIRKCQRKRMTMKSSPEQSNRQRGREREREADRECLHRRVKCKRHRYTAVLTTMKNARNVLTTHTTNLLLICYLMSLQLLEFAGYILLDALNVLSCRVEHSMGAICDKLWSNHVCDALLPVAVDASLLAPHCMQGSVQNSYTYLLSLLHTANLLGSLLFMLKRMMKSLWI